MRFVSHHILRGLHVRFSPHTTVPGGTPAPGTSDIQGGALTAGHIPPMQINIGFGGGILGIRIGPILSGSGHVNVESNPSGSIIQPIPPDVSVGI